MERALWKYLRSPEGRARLAATFWILVVFRFVAFIPSLNVDQARMNELLADNLALGVFNLFAGGEVLNNFSIVAAGIVPYVIARTLMFFLVSLIPALERLEREEGSAGRARIERLTYLLTIPIALGLAWGVSAFLNAQAGLFPGGVRLFTEATFLTTASIVVSMTAGSMFTGWLAERLTEYGIGDGPSIMVWAGACLTLVSQVRGWLAGATGAQDVPLRLITFVVVAVVVVFFGILLREGQRRIPVQYATRPRVRKTIYGGGTSHMPLRVNPGGLTPVLMANGLLALVLMAGAALQSASAGWLSNLGSGILAVLDPLGWLYWIALFVSIVLFSTLFNAVFLERQNLADALRKQGGFIPGVTSGAATSRYIWRVAGRVTLPGALGMALLVAILPPAVREITHQDIYPAVIALILTVDVVVDLLRQVEARGMMYGYESLIK